MTADCPNPYPIVLDPALKREMRTQFGALCWRMRKGGPQVLLITSRRTRRWVTPKGWPMDGSTPAGAARAEAWEEAGVEGDVSDACIGIFTYVKEMDEGDDLPCVVALYPLKVRKLVKEWPERSERRRRWMSASKAAKAVAEPELARILASFDPRTLPR